MLPASLPTTAFQTARTTNHQAIEKLGLWMSTSAADSTHPKFQIPGAPDGAAKIDPLSAPLVIVTPSGVVNVTAPDVAVSNVTTRPSNAALVATDEIGR